MRAVMAITKRRNTSRVFTGIGKTKDRRRRPGKSAERRRDGQIHDACMVRYFRLGLNDAAVGATQHFSHYGCVREQIAGLPKTDYPAGVLHRFA